MSRKLSLCERFWLMAERAPRVTVFYVGVGVVLVVGTAILAPMLVPVIGGLAVLAVGGGIAGFGMGFGVTGAVTHDPDAALRSGLIGGAAGVVGGLAAYGAMAGVAAAAGVSAAQGSTLVATAMSEGVLAQAALGGAGGIAGGAAGGFAGRTLGALSAGQPWTPALQSELQGAVQGAAWGAAIGAGVPVAAAALRLVGRGSLMAFRGGRAAWFMRRELKMSLSDIRRQLRGINLRRPVQVRTVGQGQKAYQYVREGRPSGRWFSLEPTDPLELGIAPYFRRLRVFEAASRARVLESTAAPAWDWWTVPGFEIKTIGGGTQWLARPELWVALL